MNANLIKFARDLADPHFSLSVPEQAKAVIRQLLDALETAQAAQAPAVETIRMGRERTITGEVYMATVMNGREGDEEALLEDGEYLIGLHVRPNALQIEATS